MVVQNNPAAALALVELNKNVKKAGELLTKVSTGLKIVDAKDDASGYAISEKMREQIRSLLQDNQNVQNGSSLLKIAEGGIDNIVEELRTLKELAIKSANDTNNDNDRLTIQNEFEQRKANINDIATTTDYNTKKLLDGSLGNSATVIGITRTDSGRAGSSGDLVGSFTSNDPFSQPQIDKTRNPVAPHWISDGYYVTAPDGKKCYVGMHPVTKSWEGSSGTKAYVDFSSYSVNGSVSDSLDGKGFSIACGTCQQYVAIKFDGKTDNSSYDTKKIDVAPNVVESYLEFTVGIKSVTSLNDLARAIFVGVGNARGESTGSGDTVTIDNARHNITMYMDQTSGKYVIEKDKFPLQFYGKVYNEPEPDPHYETVYGYDAPFKIHHGTQANQSVSLYINDMHTKSLGTGKLIRDGLPIGEEDLARYDALSYDDDLQKEWLETLKLAQNKNIDDVDVITGKNANVAIRVIDGAIDYALNESTRIGAYLQRLDYTDKNITVMGENVQSAESTIRDADMAKEMTEYTKTNVLQQAAQSMLAQANQNASSVLSLLQ